MIFDFLYCLALSTVSPLVVYRMARYGRYRRGLRQKLFGIRPEDITDQEAGEAGEPIGGFVWFHAVSVGEVNLIAGLVAAYRREHPDHPLVITTTTDAGYDLARSRFANETVCFCPLDFSWAVRQTLRTLRPQLLVLAELELWPNLIREATAAGCRVAVANARLSPRSGRRYQRFGRLLAGTFGRLAWIGCQDEETAARFLACGANPAAVEVTGSIKFDNAPDTRDTPDVHRLARWVGLDPWHQVLIAGSTQAGEEAAALDTYQTLSCEHRQLRLILVPRHRERFDEVAALVRARGYQVRRRGEVSPPAEHWSPTTVVLIDTIGELRHWWGVGRVAFVGGSFGARGGQNMLEPAGYGNAVCFGPNTENFREIADRLLRDRAAVRLTTPADLTRFVADCLDSPPAADDLGRRARAVIHNHRGATAKTVRRLGQLMNATENFPNELRRQAA